MIDDNNNNDNKDINKNNKNNSDKNNAEHIQKDRACVQYKQKMDTF